MRDTLEEPNSSTESLFEYVVYVHVFIIVHVFKINGTNQPSFSSDVRY